METNQLNIAEKLIIHKALELFMHSMGGGILAEYINTIFEKLETKRFLTMTESEQIEEIQRLTKSTQASNKVIEASNKVMEANCKELEAQIEANREFTKKGRAFEAKHPRLWVVIKAYYRTKFFLRKLCRRDK